MTRQPTTRAVCANGAAHAEQRHAPTYGAGSEHAATQRAVVEALNRISALFEEMAAEVSALAANLEVEVAVGAEQSVHADMPETAALDDLLSTRELCGVLHLNPRTLRRMELLGELPTPIRTGRRKTWRRETIEAWLAERERSAE